MSRILRFFFVATLLISSAEYSQSQSQSQTPTQTSSNSAKAKKLLDLQSKMNGARHSERIVTSHIMFAAKDPKTKILKDPAVSNRLINEIDEAYIDEVTKKLSEKEIDYLLLLYVSPMYQKYINLEKEFWNKKAPNIMKEKILSYQKKAPKKQ